MSQWEELKANLGKIEERIGYTFQKKDLLMAAFTHSSYVNETKAKGIADSERLEFLGDSILGLLIAEYLFQRLPEEPEGQLSQLRSQIVDATSCAKYLNTLGFSELILLSRGERIHAGQGKMSIQADTFEAIIGALYLDGGLEEVRTFLFAYFKEMIEEEIKNPTVNYKAELQDFSQKYYRKTPTYEVAKVVGPEHAKIFHVVVFLNEKEVGRGMGRSKKEAEQAAASDALSKRAEFSKESPTS